ncbi:hypothetical protein SNE40_013870 [Patella caerulea]
MTFDVKLIFIITAYVLFDTTYAGVCPVIPPFVGDLCGDMPNTQRDQSIFLKNSRFNRDARCHCDVKMASPGPTPETLRIILLSPRVDGSYCPGMNMSVESQGRVLMAIDCTQAVHFIPISNPQKGFEIKTHNLQLSGTVKSAICVSVSSHVVLTARCSRLPILTARANLPTTDPLTSLAPTGVMNLNGVSTPPPAPTNYIAAVKQHNATGTQSQSIVAPSQGAPATVQPDLGTSPPSQ